jgi:hypothetical protein
MDNIQDEIKQHNARMEVHGSNLTRVLEAGFGVGPSALSRGQGSGYAKTATELILEASDKFYATEVDDELTPEARNAFLDYLSEGHGQNARRYLMSRSEVDSKHFVRKHLEDMNF